MRLVPVKLSLKTAWQMASHHGARDWEDFDDLGRPELRWGGSFLLVTAAFAGSVWLILHWTPKIAPPPAPPPSAVMIDFAPLPAAQPAPPNDMAPGPKQTISQPPPKPEVQQPPLTAPSSPAPQIAIPLPPRPPPKPPRRHHPVTRQPPMKRLPDKTPPAPATTAPPQLQAPPAPQTAAPAPGASSAAAANAVPTWQALLLARLEQFKRYPYEAQINNEQGVVYLHFTMDRQGKVLSANIAKSSGYADLDQETLALIHRAEPLPPPPANVPGDPIELTVPVQFFLNGHGE